MATTEKNARNVMAHIPPSSLVSVPGRVRYLASFLSFSPSDGAAINASKPLLVPLVPAILDIVYSKLLEYDITAAAFVPRQDDKESGPAPTIPQDLSLNHEHIRLRQDFLKKYLVRILDNDNWTPESPFWAYLDTVGIAHTGVPGFKHRVKKAALRVEYMHLGLLLAYVEEVFVSTVLDMDQLDMKTKKAVLLAWNKVLWIQNDLFARHYIVDEATGEMPRGVVAMVGKSNLVGSGMLGCLVGICLVGGYDYLRG